MTNPTSNFGWQMPTPTDLVTDLPADFEVFGQAVDTDFADLLGGTTGQILSKASATDLDFTWITNDVGDITAVTVTAPITGGGTSGSVGIAISAATTSASGAVQLSDSTSTTSSVLASTPTATKSAYDLAASAYAPAFTNNFYAGKNKIINGDFAINQRAFTSVTANAAFTFDRFKTTNGGTSGTATYTPQTFTPGTAPVAGYEGKNLLQILTASYTVADSWGGIAQHIESVRNFAGQTVTFSFWAKAATGTPKLGIRVQQDFGTGGSPSSQVNTYATITAITTSWVRYSATISVPSISGKTLGTNNDDSIKFTLVVSAGSSTFDGAFGSMLQNNTFQTWGWQVEAGSTATPFQTASGSIGGELALCQRYYWREYPSASFGFLGNGSAANTTDVICNFLMPVEMRVTPTALDYSTLGVSPDNSTVTAITSATLTSGKSNPKLAVITAVASGFTAYRPYYLLANNSLSAHIGFSAEL